MFVKKTNIMKINKGLTREEFRDHFGTPDQCLQYLSDQKWAGGYSCRKCGHGKHANGKKEYNRRCTKCGYDESPTAHSMFHKLKFGIDKAFEMTFDIVTSKKGANSIWLAEKYGIKQTTAWYFRQKVQVNMKSSERFPLEKEVHVDEFEIGTPKKGEPGRSPSKGKVRVVIALEYRDGKPGRGYAKQIEDYSSESLRPIFDTHIRNDASVVTDGWAGYSPLKEQFPKLEQRLSDKGRNFTMLHIQIRNFKNWLRGVHSYCNREYLHRYIDEYFYRFNRLNFRDSIFEKLLNRMTCHEPVTYEQITCSAT